MSPLSLLILLAPSWLALAWLVTKAQWFWSHNPELSFGWAVLVLCGYLFFQAWPKPPPLRLKWSVLSVAAAVMACFVLFVTQIYQAAYGLTPASMSGLGLGFLLVVCSNLVFVWGWPGVRHFGFSFGFMLVALPIPSLITAPIIDGLQVRIASFDAELLNLIGIPAMRTGKLITIAAGTVGIDEACSGIRSLQASLMISLFLGQLYGFNLMRRLAFIAAGFALAVFFNLVRTFLLVCIASNAGLGGVGKWHDATGTGILVACFLGLWGLGVILRRQPRSEPALQLEKTPEAVQ
ncbi:MAG: exosortase/archaeosortase family protein [Verrucomicrobia bacterium]|nr:exosortase/archaeosortase family protein [Verrucomicrobiota bacterium]